MKNRIKELRVKQGITGSSLHKRLGISQKTLNNYENGRTEIPSRVLIKLTEIFGVSADYILGIKKYTTITVVNSKSEVLASISNDDVIEREGYKVILSDD